MAGREPVTQGPSGSQGWVLIVEESPGLARALQILLEEERGRRVEVAFSHSEAGSVLEAGGPPDVAICELEMAGPAGLDLITWVRHRYPEIPIVASTALPPARTRSVAARLGVVACLGKPIDPGELLAAVDLVLQPARDPSSSETSHR